MTPMRQSGDESKHVPHFSLAEAIPADSRHGHSSESKLEHFRPGRWFRRNRTGLSELSSLRCRGDWSDTLVRSSSSARQHLGALVKLGPQGDGTCDHNPTERAINIVTSLPYFALGLNTYRKAQSNETKLFGASIMGVGVGAVGFHASSGKARHWGRKLDYWAIAAATAALVRAVYPDMSRHKTAASLLLTPLQPLAMTCANTAGVEVEYLRQAHKNPELRQAHRVHLGTGVVGAGVFFLEYTYPTAPLIHTVWHGLSAASLWSLSALVEDADNRREGWAQPQGTENSVLPIEL